MPNLALLPCSLPSAAGAAESMQAVLQVPSIIISSAYNPAGNQQLAFSCQNTVQAGSSHGLK